MGQMIDDSTLDYLMSEDTLEKKKFRVRNERLEMDLLPGVGMIGKKKESKETVGLNNKTTSC